MSGSLYRSQRLGPGTWHLVGGSIQLIAEGIFGENLTDVVRKTLRMLDILIGI